MKQKVILSIVAAAIVVGGIYLYVRNHKAAAPSDNNTTGAIDANTGEFVGDVPGDSPDNNPTVPTSDTIAVSTQIAGDSVTIDNAFLEKPGFISIHEVDSKGQPGAVIGYSGYLTVGPKQDLEVRANIKPGGKYIAMVHVDDGDKKFSATADKTVTKNNLPLMTMFSVSK